MPDEPKPLPVPRGVHCPACSSLRLKLVKARARARGTTARRRECRDCGRRFTTFERVDPAEFHVTKPTATAVAG